MEQMVLLTWLGLAIYALGIACIVGAVAYLIGLGFLLPAAIAAFGIMCFFAGLWVCR